MSHIPLVLESSSLRLQLLPTFGARIGRLQARAGEKLVDLLCPYEQPDFDPLAWPKHGAFPLIPYSNRIRQAAFSFQGRYYRLPAHPAAAPDTLHGVCHALAWQVVSLSHGAVKLAVEYDGQHWPWPIRAEQRFCLDDDCLTIELSVKNLGTSSMPGGIGFHPYFLVEAGFSACFSAARQWALGADRFPLAPVRPLGRMVRLTSADWQDADYLGHYSGIDDDIVLRYAGGVLAVRPGHTLRHLVGFAPKDGRYLCLEPVSHVADMLNMSDADADDIGLYVLPPGASLNGEISMRWHALAAYSTMRPQVFPL